MIGSFLQKRLHQLGLTQQQAANILEISQSRLNQYLKNRREPDSKMLIRICKTFNTTTNFLFGFNELSHEENQKRIVLILKFYKLFLRIFCKRHQKKNFFVLKSLGK